jgi:hypothetical protein
LPISRISTAEGLLPYLAAAAYDIDGSTGINELNVCDNFWLNGYLIGVRFIKKRGKKLNLKKLHVFDKIKNSWEKVFWYLLIYLCSDSLSKN